MYGSQPWALSRFGARTFGSGPFGSGGLVIYGDLAGFLADGVGEVRIKMRMVAAVTDLTIDEMHYPMTNEFFGFRRTATGGQFVVNDGTSVATVDYDWEVGETVVVIIEGDGLEMRIGEQI